MGDLVGGNILLSLVYYIQMNYFFQFKDIILLFLCVDMVLDNFVIFDYELRDFMFVVEGYDVIWWIWVVDKLLDDLLISLIYGDFEGFGKIIMFVGIYEGLFFDIMKFDKMFMD